MKNKFFLLSIIIHCLPLISLMSFGDSSSTNKETIEFEVSESKSAQNKVKGETQDQENFGSDYRQIVEPSTIGKNKHSYFYGIGIKLGETKFLTYDSQRVQGIKVIEVYPSYPASKAGLASGDVILRVNDQKMTSTDKLIFNHPQKASITYYRNSRVYQALVNVDKIQVQD